MFDIAIISLRITFFPTDSDVFAELEKDPLIKSRFEEEAATELQQGWNRGKGNSPDEIQALLDQPRGLEEGNASQKSWVTAKVRTSDEPDEDAGTTSGGDVSGLDIVESGRLHKRRESFTHTGFDEELAQQFGAVIRKPFRQTTTT